jgi:multiple sugar transport system permease protein
MNCLIALVVNLAGTLLIYSLLAFALVRLSWHRRGMIAVLVPIVIAGQFWIVPTLLVRNSSYLPFASYAFWFCNWLISGFSVIVLCQAVRWIPRQLEDSARLDGCGWFGTYWHILLPLVRRELWLIVFLTLLGTSIPLFAPLAVFRGEVIAPWLVWLLPVWSEGGPSLARSIGLMMGVSLAATLPMIVVFLFAKGPLRQDITLTG